PNAPRQTTSVDYSCAQFLGGYNQFRAHRTSAYPGRFSSCLPSTRSKPTRPSILLHLGRRRLETFWRADRRRAGAVSRGGDVSGGKFWFRIDREMGYHGKTWHYRF